MDEKKAGSAYRGLRGCAYRKKFDIALFFGSKAFSYGDLLTRAEYAYNSFRQMGVEKGERVCLWLPDCPDLLAAFYGLSRLGAIPVLCHPQSVPRELQNQMETTQSKLLVTTPFRYRQYLERIGTFPDSHLILCRPERDLKGREQKEFSEKEPACQVGGFDFEELLKANRYNANEIPALEPEIPAVILFGSSGFLSCEPVSYLSGELEETVEIFDCRRERIQTVFVENSFASEGGFLAVHSALCRGITVLWSVGDPLPYLAKKMPDYLVGTEEFFWELRQKTDLFKGNWVNLLGGIQIGKDRTPLMSKFAAKAFLETGGKGALLNAPIPLKVQKEELYFVKDFGVRLADMERAISSLPGVAACQCIGEGSGIRLRLQPAGNTDAAALGRKVLAYCREEMNEFHVPEKLEFSANIQ